MSINPTKEEEQQQSGEPLAKHDYTWDKNCWTLIYESYNPKKIQLRECLCTVGNGIFATRGASEESSADGVNYPATYIVGGYNRTDSNIDGNVVSTEDMVNFPNWLPLTFRIVDEKECSGSNSWFSINKDGSNLESYRLELDLKSGVLHRKIIVKDQSGRITTINSERFVNMHTTNPHFGVIEYSVTPENWSGEIQIRSSLDGSVQNKGVARYSQLNNKHLKIIAKGKIEKEGIFLQATTTQSRFEVCEAARTRCFIDRKKLEKIKTQVIEEEEKIHEIFTFEIKKRQTVKVEKVVSLHTNRDKGSLETKETCLAHLLWGPSSDYILKRSSLKWSSIWDICDMIVESKSEVNKGLEQITARVHIYHLLAVVSLNTLGYDFGAPARGLHGESYHMHIFWDELFILPFYTLRLPEITKTLLKYRYVRLAMAKYLAQEKGFKGALFPWQSGSLGIEESQKIHLNPLSGKWDNDSSSLQRHVSLAIAFNIFRFYDSTKDFNFMEKYGSEMIIEICRFWASCSVFNKETHRYEIKNVMGPDEYHEYYDDDETKSGLNNNCYTNVMVVWLMMKALKMVKSDLRPTYKKALINSFEITQDEIELWGDITKKMTVIFHKDGIWSQFEGFEQLEELDWSGYRKKYKNIERLDRILKSEGISPNKYKLSKQADVCMLFYLLTSKELSTIFNNLGYPFPNDIIQRNIYYYLARTSHGSTLSKLVYSSILQPYDRDLAFDLFQQAMLSDIDDLQGTTGEGIHMGLMSGTVNTLATKYAGVDTSRDLLHIKPHLPPALSKISFSMEFRNVCVNITVEHDKVVLKTESPAFLFFVRGVLAISRAGKDCVFPLKHTVVDAQGRKVEEEDTCYLCKIGYKDGKKCALCGLEQCETCRMGLVSLVSFPSVGPIQVCVKCYERETWENLKLQKEGCDHKGERMRNKRIPHGNLMEEKRWKYIKKMARLLTGHRDQTPTPNNTVDPWN